jgi:hypothetical protein
MRRISSAVILFLSFIATTCFCTSPAFAEAAYFSQEQMIVNSRYIALVNIVKAEDVSVQSKHLQYSKKSQAVVEESIKGDLKAGQRVNLYGGENFMCAHTEFNPGQAVVFLSQEGDLLFSANWQLGVRKCKNGQVIWSTSENKFAQDEVPYSSLVKEIKSMTDIDLAKAKLSQDLKIICTTDVLDDGTQGEAPFQSSVFLAYQRLVRSKIGIDQLTDAFNRASSEGQVYLAILIYQQDQKLGEKYIRDIWSGGDIQFKSGCEVLQVPRFEVTVQLLSRKKYGNLNLR